VVATAADTDATRGGGLTVRCLLSRDLPAVPKLEIMLGDAAPDLLAFTSFPVSHWKKVGSTNPLERLNKEWWP
jgi:hypothetical protein